MIKIGITASYENSGTALNDVIENDYIRSIIQCGGLPVIIPVIRDKAAVMEYIPLINGILLSGGADVNPELYYETKI